GSPDLQEPLIPCHHVKHGVDQHHAANGAAVRPVQQPLKGMHGFKPLLSPQAYIRSRHRTSPTGGAGTRGPCARRMGRLPAHRKPASLRAMTWAALSWVTKPGPVYT